MDDVQPVEREPTLFRNTISMVGASIATLAALNIAFLVFVDFFHPSPYVGIFAYMVLPAVSDLRSCVDSNWDGSGAPTPPSHAAR